MNGFIFSMFSSRGGAAVIPPPEPEWPTYPDYKVGMFKVVDNYVGGNLSANTGLSYDKNRRFIYSSITPNSSGGIFVFNEAYEFQSNIPIPAGQGHMYNPIDDTFTMWYVGGLNTYSYAGTLIKGQSGFWPYGESGPPPGCIVYNDIDDEMAITGEWGDAESGDVIIYKRDGAGDWQYNRSLGVTNAIEGVCWDEDRDCYWYNTKTTIVQITKTGTVIKTIPQVTETINVTEGLAYNPNKKTIYVNSDKGYHGGTIDGNRCVELWPGFYE